MMKTVLVFGATGTVGAYTCLYLKDMGYPVIASGRRTDDNGFFSDYGIKYFPVNVSDKKSFSVLPRSGIGVIVNLSGALPARMKGYEPQVYIDTNITGSLNILEYAAAVSASRVIFTQSISDVAYLCGQKSPIDEDSVSYFPLNNDHSVYSITKTAACNLLKHFSSKYGFRHYVLRFPNIYLYHPNPKYYVDGEERWQGYRLMIHKALAGEPLSVWGDPGKVRDIVYVKDCCQMIEKCISVESAPSGTYNVGTGIGTTMQEQVEGIVEVCSSGGGDICFEPDKPDTTEYVFSIDKAERYLNYHPKYDYKAYLRDFMNELKEQRFQKLWGKDNFEVI